MVDMDMGLYHSHHPLFASVVFVEVHAAAAHSVPIHGSAITTPLESFTNVVLHVLNFLA